MKTNKFSTSDKKKALQKENNEDGDEEDEEEEDDEEDREKIAKKSSQNQISKKSVINKETKITTIRKEEKPKIATQTTQGVYKPRLISTQNQEKNVTKEAGGIRRALKEKRPLHQSDIAQISKKPETLKTSQNTSNTQAKNPVSQTQTKVNAQPQVSKYQNRYTKRQVDSIGNNDDNSKEIKSSKENINDHKKNERWPAWAGRRRCSWWPRRDAANTSWAWQWTSAHHGTIPSPLLSGRPKKASGWPKTAGALASSSVTGTNGPM